jgi:hypothetical protein
MHLNHIIRKDQYLLDTCRRHVYDDNYMNIVFVQNRGKYNNRYIIPNKNVTGILSGQHKRPGRYQSLQLIKRTSSLVPTNQFTSYCVTNVPCCPRLLSPLSEYKEWSPSNRWSYKTILAVQFVMNKHKPATLYWLIKNISIPPSTRIL